jgi:hypothetical protein
MLVVVSSIHVHVGSRLGMEALGACIALELRLPMACIVHVLIRS